jgi:predicted SnoaL-like aldol condensation-catalyzing enzyme
VDDDNIRVARQFVEEVFAKNRPELLDEILSSDFTEHHRAIAGNVDGLRAAIAGLHSASPDVEYRLINTIAQDDLVCLQYRSVGTQTGNLGPFPPSGKRFDVDVVDIFRVQEGKIVEHWSLPDRMAKMEDLGFWPPKPS